MIRTIVLIGLLSLTCTSCHHFFGKRERGSGNVATTTREAHAYGNIDVRNAIDVYVKQDSTESVKVVTDDNLQRYIQVRVEGGTLYINLEDNINISPTSGIKVYVSGPVFGRFKASGACNYYTENSISDSAGISIVLTGASDAKMELKAPKIKADLTGAGSLILKGETKDLELIGTGSSSLKCMNMMAENVSVNVTGASDAEVFASVKLDVDATGASNITYKGNATVNQRSTGASSVRKVD